MKTPVWRLLAYAFVVLIGAVFALPAFLPRETAAALAGFLASTPVTRDPDLRETGTGRPQGQFRFDPQDAMDFGAGRAASVRHSVAVAIAAGSAIDRAAETMPFPGDGRVRNAAPRPSITTQPSAST